MLALFWLQVALEISGAILSFRRRLRILFAYMAFSAVADLVLYAIQDIHPLYGYSSWSAEAVQYAILYALGIQLAAKMVQDYRPLTQYVYKAVALAASVATYIFVTTELWERKFLHAEAVSSLLLLAVVLVGWIGRKKRLEEPWRSVTTGLLISASGNALCAILSSQWNHGLGLYLYPIPAILALLIWNWSVLPRKRMRLEKFRGEPNQERKPVRSVVGLSAADEKFLKEMRIQA